jgi:hypothetical protein
VEALDLHEGVPLAALMEAGLSKEEFENLEQLQVRSEAARACLHVRKFLLHSIPTRSEEITVGDGDLYVVFSCSLCCQRHCGNSPGR